MAPRNSRVAPEVQIRSPARSLARSLDSYYRPARDRRGEQALQQGLRSISGLFEEQAARAKQDQRQNEFQQGVADAMREQAGEELEGVKTGSLFRQHSSFYTAGLNETRGKAQATEFKNNLALAYENWEGRHTDDDGSGFRDWMNGQIGEFMGTLGEDESRLAGALPVLNEVANNFAARHTAFTNDRLKTESFEAYQTITGGIFDDFAVGNIDEDTAIENLLEEVSLMYDMEGGEAKNAMVDATIRYANVHNDPDAILLMARAHDKGKIKLSIANQERLADAMDAVEADIARETAKSEAKRTKEQDAAHQAALADWGEQLAQDAFIELPRVNEVGVELWTDMKRLQDAHITASENISPVDNAMGRLSLDQALFEAGTAREKMSTLTSFVQANPNVLTPAEVSRYSKDIQTLSDPTSLPNNSFFKDGRRSLAEQIGQFETDVFDPSQIGFMQTKAERYYNQYLLAQVGKVDQNDPQAIFEADKAAREYAVGRLTDEHPELVRERASDSPVTQDLGFDQAIADQDAAAAAEFQQMMQQQAAPEEDPEPITRGEEDAPFEDPDDENVVYTPEREGFYGQLINRFTDGRDDRRSMATAISIYQEDPGFARELDRLGEKYDINPAALMAVMDFETGGTFDPAEPNRAGSGATGLIQFMPDTARALGTTTDELAQMSRQEQMQYVEKYFDQFGSRIRGGEVDDLYMAVLWPKAIGKADGYVIFRQGTKAYEQNKGLDTNGDGTVTKYEAASRVARKFYGY